MVPLEISTLPPLLLQSLDAPVNGRPKARRGAFAFHQLDGLVRSISLADQNAGARGCVAMATRFAFVT